MATSTSTSTSRQRTARTLLNRHGQTFVAEAGIHLKDTPQPLYQTLVLSCLLSARIRSSMAVAAAHSLFADGMRGAQRMTEATWQQRVDALGKGGYRRYDERTATQLGEGAALLRDAYGGDLRTLRAEADQEAPAMRRLLRRVPGLGPTGTDIFLREVQAVWPELRPYLDRKALQGAQRLGLPETARDLAALVDEDEVAPLASALVRAALDKKVVEDVQANAEAPGRP